MKKIRTKEATIVTKEDEINLKISLFDDNGQYKIMAETNEECEFKSCGSIDLNKANRLVEILSTNGVMPHTMAEIVDDICIK